MLSPPKKKQWKRERERERERKKIKWGRVKKKRASVPFGPLFHDATNDRYGNNHDVMREDKKRQPSFDKKVCKLPHQVAFLLVRYVSKKKKKKWKRNLMFLISIPMMLPFFCIGSHTYLCGVVVPQARPTTTSNLLTNFLYFYCGSSHKTNKHTHTHTHTHILLTKFLGPIIHHLFWQQKQTN